MTTVPGRVMNNRPRIALANSTTEYVLRFRLPLLAALRNAGFEPVVVAPPDGSEKALTRLGYPCSPLTLDGAGMNPLRELGALRALTRLYRAIGPSLALHFTPKVDIYGGLAARRLGIPAINNLSGMGTAFTRGGLLGFVVKQLMRVSQRAAAHIFVQNPDDAQFVADAGIARPQKLSTLPGSGIDLEQFPLTPLPSDTGQVHFVLIARLVREKGVIEFMEAARQLRTAGVPARFSIAGAIPPGAGIDAAQVTAWGEAPEQAWLGKVSDVQAVIAASDCVVLPSYYREGTPRVLLEAAAMGRPVIAADAIGTREPVIPHETGLLCQPRAVHDLAECMKAMVDMSRDRRQAMGLAGRRLMQTKYDVRFVVDAYMQRIHQVLRE